MRSLPASLQSKLSQQMQTVHNDADPRMEVVVARARTTVVDYSYWTVETIRETSGLGDVSVAPRRFRPYGSPNRIYEIHVHNGEVKTAIREYPDRLKDGWKDQFSLGPGSSVAIAFDGYWERFRKLWRLITDEKPWLFWVDGGNVLWSQHWDDVATKTQLDTGVARVRAIRAWKNVNMADKDQGIVVGYIKTDGVVWYRNYCQQADYSYMWENPKQLTQFTATAVSLNMFITNDYRMGFVVQDNANNIHWFITDRNWAGMAIGADYIRASVSGSVELIEIEKLDAYNTEYISASVGGTIEYLYTMSDNAFRTAENFSIEMIDEEEQPYQNWGFRIRVKTAHNFTAIDVADFTLKDGNNMNFIINSVTRTGNREYEISTVDFNNAYGDLTLSFTGEGSTKGEIGQTLDSFNITFTPQNLVPSFIPLPEVEVIWNE
jgi:hypothetical protein